MKSKAFNAHLLERYILNELPPRQMEEMKIRINEDPSLKEQLEKIKHSNKDILNQYSADTVVPQILDRCRMEKSKAEYRIRQRPGFLKRLLYASPALAAALLLLFILLPGHREIFEPGVTGSTDVTHIKGEETIDTTKPNLVVYRQAGGNIELLKSGAKAKQGDLLQIAYISAGENFGVIFSIDGNGAVTLHYPEHKKQSTFLKKEKKVLLESAYELDDAPGFERFFFITSPVPINVDDVLKKAGQLARDPNRAETANIELKQSFKQTSVLIEKGDQP